MIRMPNLSHTTVCKSEDGSAASPVGDLMHPRGLLPSAIPAKAIAEVVSRYRRQLKTWLEESAVLTNTGPLCCLKLAKYASQHGAAAVARGFSRKLEEQGI